MEQLIQFISIITVVQMFIMIFYILGLQKVSLGNRLLIAFLVVNAVYILYYLLFLPNGFLSGLRIYFYRLGIPVRLLFGPVLYLYTRSLLSSQKIVKKDYPHFIPFGLELLAIIFTYHIFGIAYKQHVLNGGIWIGKDLFLYIFYFFQVQVLTYMALCLRLVHRHENRLKDRFSSLERIKLSWLRLILYAFIFMWMTDLMSYLISLLFQTGHYAPYMNLVSIGINLIFAILLVFKGLKYPNLLLEPLDPNNIRKYQKSGLNSSLKKTYKKQLSDLIQDQKPHLNPSLTLKNLSEMTNIPQNYLSQVINETFNCNFYDFINGHRIKEAIPILTDPKRQHLSILEILYDVGFNSKSTFYSAFAKETGMTPKAYKNKFDIVNSA